MWRSPSPSMAGGLLQMRDPYSFDEEDEDGGVKECAPTRLSPYRPYRQHGKRNIFLRRYCTYIWEKQRIAVIARG